MEHLPRVGFAEGVGHITMNKTKKPLALRKSIFRKALELWDTAPPLRAGTWAPQE